MAESTVIFRYLPTILLVGEILVAIFSSYLIYIGLSTKSQRIQSRLRMREQMHRNRRTMVKVAQETKAESMLKAAGYPLRMNGLRYHIFYTILIIFLIVNYVLLPILIGAQISTVSLVFIGLVYILLLPNFPYSLFKFVIKRAVDYKLARRNSEVFVLYDLIINEIEMMTNNRLNTYNLLKNLKGYFKVIDIELTRLLSNWTGSGGSSAALDQFAKDIDTKEIKALVSVLKNLDEMDQETALTALRGMSKMFVRSQIENYRRRRKVFTDLASIPIKSSHFIIILNIVVVVIVMVMNVMNASH